MGVAYDKGKATDPVKYFAAKENQDWGVVKALRKPVPKLHLSPFPLTPLTNAQLVESMGAIMLRISLLDLDM